MLAALLLVLIARPDTCSACLVRDREVVLCPPHAEEDREIVAREVKRLRSREPAEQLAALEAVAALTQAHANAPSPRVARVLAGGLEVAAPEVRKRAAELLGPPQHAPEAMRALLGALGEVDREVAAADEELQRHRKVPEPTSPKTSQEYWKELDRSLEAKTLAMKVQDVLHAALQWRDVLLERLGSFADDRVVAALARSQAIATTDAGLRSLLALGNRAALEALLAALARWQDTPAEASSEVAQQARARRGRLLQQGLADLAAKHGLLPCPEESARPHAAWLAWWKLHADAIPAALPGVRAPAW